MSADRKAGLLGSAVLIGSALAVSVCGGSSKSNPEGTKTSGNKTEVTATLATTSSATVVVEAPTVAPTATVEVPVLTVDVLKDQIDTVYAGRTFPQINMPMYIDSNSFKAIIDHCTQSTFTDRSDAAQAASACQDLGEGTLKIYQATRDEKFWDLNQTLWTYAKDKMTDINSQVIHNPDFKGFLDDVHRRFFTKPQ